METRECKTESRSMVDALATASHTSCAPFRRSSAPDDRLAVGCVNEWVSVWHLVRLAVGQTGGGMQQVWQQKLPFTFAHATAAAGAKPAWPNAGLGVCVPRQTRRAWRAKSGRRRVQTCVTGCNQAASCKEVGTLATSFLGLHTLSALPWVLAHSHTLTSTKQSPQSPLETNWI